MGEIWKASDLQKSQNVAVYLPSPEIRKDESATESVKKNAKRVEALDHPHIVPTMESFIDPEHGFFTVRKWVSGSTLDVFRQGFVQRHKKLAPIDAVKILNNIAHALDYAHRVDIIHGGLCPKSITIGQGGNVFLDNFSLFPVPVDKASPTRKPYLPPEVLEGNVATVHSDIYALAVIDYELLSGRLPYSPESMDMLLPIPHAPSAVDTVVRKAMEKLPEDRYDSCGMFVRSLESGFQEPKTRSVAVSPPSKLTFKTIIANALLWGLALTFIGTAFYGFVHFDDVKSTLLNIAQNLGEPLSEPEVSLPPHEESSSRPKEPLPPSTFTELSQNPPLPPSSIYEALPVEEDAICVPLPEEATAE
jgi:serine/threonine-protein kinase